MEADSFGHVLMVRVDKVNNRQSGLRHLVWLRFDHCGSVRQQCRRGTSLTLPRGTPWRRLLGEEILTSMKCRIDLPLGQKLHRISRVHKLWKAVVSSTIHSARHVVCVRVGPSPPQTVVTYNRVRYVLDISPALRCVHLQAGHRVGRKIGDRPNVSVACVLGLPLGDVLVPTRLYPQQSVNMFSEART